MSQTQSQSTSRKAALKAVVAVVCRSLLGLTFVFSGYVKAVDPLGTQYKIGDYLAAMGLAGFVPDGFVLCVAVALAAFEFCLGILLLPGVGRRWVTKVGLAWMALMTALTVWIAVANPVQDCGCFGDAIRLTNTQTLLKNIVLLFFAIGSVACPLRWTPKVIRPIWKLGQTTIIGLFSLAYILLTSGHCLYHLPIFDFRPYHVGVNIKHDMEIPPGAKQPQFETTFTLQKNGVKREFTLDNYPDTTWTFVDAKTVQLSEGYVPPIHDFSIQTANGIDITDDVLTRRGYTFLLIAPDLSKASQRHYGDIDFLCDYARQNDAAMMCLTASTKEDICDWQNLTGAVYPFLTTDETTLKTIIRSNPGLLLLRDGTIIGKWSDNDLPKGDVLRGPLAQSRIGQPHTVPAAVKIVIVALLYIVPLAVIGAFSRWLWRRKRIPQEANAAITT